MKKTIQVMNIKCNGCASTITKALEKIGVTEIEIIIEGGEICYSHGPEKQTIINLLSHLGYPEVGSREAEDLLKKAKSYISCAIGKL